MSAPTPGPWDYVPGTEHHGPYVTSDHGNTICDCYTMSQPSLLSTASGGPSKPVLFLAEMADPNARLIAAAPELLEALRWALGRLSDARNVCYGGVTVEEIEEREAVLTKATGK